MVPITEASARKLSKLMAKRIELSTSMAWRSPALRSGMRGAAGGMVAVVAGVVGFTMTAVTKRCPARMQKGGAKPPFGQACAKLV